MHAPRKSGLYISEMGPPQKAAPTKEREEVWGVLFLGCVCGTTEVVPSRRKERPPQKAASTGASMARLIGGAWGGLDRMWSGLADEEGKARKGEAAGDVVDYVHLTEIEAGLQG